MRDPIRVFIGLALVASACSAPSTATSDEVVQQQGEVAASTSDENSASAPENRLVSAPEDVQELVPRPYLEKGIAELTETIASWDRSLDEVIQSGDAVTALSQIVEQTGLKTDWLTDAQWSTLGMDEVVNASGKIETGLNNQLDTWAGMFMADPKSCEVCFEPAFVGDRLVLEAELDQVFSLTSLSFNPVENPDTETALGVMYVQRLREVVFARSAATLDQFLTEFLECKDDQCRPFLRGSYWSAAGLLMKHTIFNPELHGPYLEALEKLNDRTNNARELDHHIFMDFLATQQDGKQVYGSYIACKDGVAAFVPPLRDVEETRDIRARLELKTVEESLQSFQESHCAS